MTTRYDVTTIQQTKLLDAASKSAVQIGIIPNGTKFSTTEKDGDFFYFPARSGWVYKYKGTSLALTYTVIVDPPVDPPPASADKWGIVNVSTDATERTNDPATRPLTDATPPKPTSTKGTPIWILGWETFVKLINVLASWIWLLKPLTMWINRDEMRAEQICCSCNIIHIIGGNETHYMIETLYNTADVSRLDPYEYNWLFKPWLFHQALMRNGRTGGIFLVGNGKYVYFPLLRTESAPMWIRKEYVELLPTTLNGKQITSFRFLGASIYGMVDGEEVALRLHPKRDDFYQHPDWPLVTQGCIPPA